MDFAIIIKPLPQKPNPQIGQSSPRRTAQSDDRPMKQAEKAKKSTPAQNIMV